MCLFSLWWYCLFPMIIDSSSIAIPDEYVQTSFRLIFFSSKLCTYFKSKWTWHCLTLLWNRNVKCQTSYQFIKPLILIRIDFQFISYVPYPINISFIVKRVQNRIIFGLLLFGMIKSIEMTNNHSKGNNKMNTKQK